MVGNGLPRGVYIVQSKTLNDIQILICSDRLFLLGDWRMFIGKLLK